MAHLITGDPVQQKFLLEENVTTIGRDPSNIIVLNDSKVSREHCRIIKENDRYWIDDLRSSNGTYLYENLITSKHELHEGDRIRVGRTLFLFTKPSAPLMPEEKHTGKEPDYKALLIAHQNLKALYEINAMIRSIFDIDTLLEKILSAIIKVLKAERGFILLKDENTGELIPKAVHNRNAREISVSKTIVNKIFETGESIITRDAMSDERFASGKSIVDYHIRSCLCVPLKSKDKISGIIHVDNKVSSHSFTVEDLALLSAIGSETGVVLENAGLYEKNLRAERLAAIGETIAGLSHYIKNILTGVEGGRTLVEMGIDKNNRELLKKGWEIVSRSNERISRLVLNMLDFSKERKPVREKTNLNEIVEEIASAIEEKCKQESIKIIIDIDKNIPAVEIDPAGIHRAVLNIASNAVDALTDSEQEKNKIIFKTFTTPSNVNISISDNGKGVPEKDIPHIFDVFYSSKGSGGTGLGLAVSKKIIKEHNAEINVESKKGQGTTFTISF